MNLTIFVTNFSGHSFETVSQIPETSSKKTTHMTMYRKSHLLPGEEVIWTSGQGVCST